mmetsp:Transcript_56851/g.112954  ORF Transcript_56851/g.112954 Transcript_56851/m.112954 type:complete len:110 (-) Transcript_56851:31-360(-)
MLMSNLMAVCGRAGASSGEGMKTSQMNRLEVHTLELVYGELPRGAAKLPNEGSCQEPRAVFIISDNNASRNPRYADIHGTGGPALSALAKTERYSTLANGAERLHGVGC